MAKQRSRSSLRKAGRFQPRPAARGRRSRGRARLYEQAVAAGDVDAMFNLGRLIEADDPERARALWQRAAAAGHPEAQERL